MSDEKKLRGVYLCADTKALGKTLRRVKEAIAFLGAGGILEVTTPDLMLLERELEQSRKRVSELEARLAQFTGEMNCGISHELFDMCCDERDQALARCEKMRVALSEIFDKAFGDMEGADGSEFSNYDQIARIARAALTEGES